MLLWGRLEFDQYKIDRKSAKPSKPISLGKNNRERLVANSIKNKKAANVTAIWQILKLNPIFITKNSSLEQVSTAIANKARCSNSLRLLICII